MPPEPINLTIRNDLADLPTVSQMLDSVARRAGMRAQTLMQLQVALDEILSNAINYAWPDGGSHYLRISFDVLDDAIEVVIVDDGQPFDPRAQAPPEPATPGSRPRPGGLGIHLVRQLVDEFRYARVDDCNRVTLTKRYTSALSQQGK
jgi:anti-sigma regulatory factor (Ser/Thr protein kinase)